MRVVAAAACSSIRFFNSPSPSTRRRPVRERRARCTRWCSIPAKVWWRGSSASRKRVCSSGVAGSSISSISSMRIAAAELFRLTLPLLEPFIISGGSMTERRSVIVVLHDAEGHVGYGEAPPVELPFYSEETLVGATDVTRRVLLPRVVGREFLDPAAVDAALREGIRGNPFARAGVETAAWDLEAHR